MSGQGSKDRITDAADSVLDSVTDTATRARDEATTRANDVRDNAESEMDYARDTADEAQGRVKEGVEDAKSKAHAESIEFSDKVSDALNDAGEKFGGLIDKAKSIFGDHPKKD